MDGQYTEAHNIDSKGKLTLAESNTLQCYYKYINETQQQSHHIQKREAKHSKREQIL